MEYTDYTGKLRKDYGYILAALAALGIFLWLQLAFGHDMIAHRALHLDLTIVALVLSCILVLYVSFRIALVVGLVTAVIIAYLNIEFPYFMALLLGATAIAYFFIIRMKLEHERLLRVEQERERELQNAMRRLERMSNQKDEVLFTASHDLRTPVSIIRSNLATIQDGYAGKVNKEAKVYIDAAYRASERLRLLLEDILEASAVEHKEELVLRPVQVEEVIGSIMEAHASNAGKLQLTYPLKPYKTPKVWADPHLLRRAFENLITNSMKYTKEGHIAVRVESKERKVICHFEDTGIGIAPQEQEMLFTKFYRGSNVSQSDQRGSGLGLYITKQIVQRMRGRIYFSSQLNKGTTFHVELPVVKR